MRLDTRFILAAVLALMMVSTVPTFAAGEATKTRTFDAQSINSIELKAGVGDVRIEQGSGNDIEVRVTLVAKRNTGIFSSLPDVEKIDIAATTRGDQLEIGVDAKNVEERWVLRLPKKTLSALEVKVGVGEVRVSGDVKRLEVDLGVGDVRIDVPNSAIEVQVGTGSARIKTALESAGVIEGKTGVGDVSLIGLEGSVKTRAVGGRVDGKGRGDQPIEVTVGVGNLQIELGR